MDYWGTKSLSLPMLSSYNVSLFPKRQPTPNGVIHNLNAFYI